MLLPQNTHFSGFSPWMSTPCLIQFILSGLSLYSSKILLTETTLDKSFFVFFKNNVKLKFLSKLTKSIFCGLFMFSLRIRIFARSTFFSNSATAFLSSCNGRIGNLLECFSNSSFISRISYLLPTTTEGILYILDF